MGNIVTKNPLLNDPMEDDEMTDSSLNATEIAVGSLLAGNNGSGGGGYGAWGGGGGGYAPFASPGSNAIRIQEGNRQTAAGIENLLDQNQFAATNSAITNSCNRVTDKLDVQACRQADLTTNAEFRTADRLRDIEREMNANSRIAADCCCDLKLQGCQDKAEIMAAIANSNATVLAVEGRAVERALNNANAELTSLKTQIACNCNCPS